MGELIYKIGRPTEEEQVTLDFRDGLLRSVDERISLGLIPLRLPVINDVPYRVFESLDDYRAWADRELPRYLGYYRP
jgi:hypothetical protein